MTTETYNAELCENCIYTHFVGEPLDGYTDTPLTKLATDHTITVEYESNHFNPGHCDGCELSLGHNSQDVIVTEWNN